MPLKLFKSKQASNVDDKFSDVYGLIVRLAENGAKVSQATHDLASELEALQKQVFDLRNMIQVEKDMAYYSGYQQAIVEASVDNSLLVKQKN